MSMLLDPDPDSQYGSGSITLLYRVHLKARLLAISVEEPLLGHARLSVLQHTGGLRLLRNI
jgi:hypothetical protein